MKTLITGPSGFVGQNLIPHLEARGFGVAALSLRGEWVDSMPGDYDAIIHLAGKAHDTRNISEPSEYFAVNSELTKQLFDRFLENPEARDFIYFSSVKAAADKVEGVLEESMVPDPKTPYGKSKWQAEDYLQSKILGSKKRVFILRPCMIHGPGNKGNLNLLYKVVSKGLPWPLAAFDNRRSFLSIANLQFIVQAILQNPSIPGGIYHLADDEALATNELIQLIGEARGRKAKLWRISQRLIRKLATFGDTIPLPLNTERLRKLTENYEVSNTKIKSALGVSELPQSAREGLLRTLRSF